MFFELMVRERWEAGLSVTDAYLWDADLIATFRPRRRESLKILNLSIGFHSVRIDGLAEIKFR